MWLPRPEAVRRGRRLLAGMGLVALLGACASGRVGDAGEAGVVHHVVLVWLRDPDDAAERTRLIETSRALADIPGVEALYVGPVLPGERDIVDDSFDVGLYFRFASVQAMQRYIHHPRHVRAVREVIRPLTRRLRVHDFTSGPGGGVDAASGNPASR